MNNANPFINALKGLVQAYQNRAEQSIEHIILIGAHGTGKSTLANALSKELDIPVTESIARATKQIFEGVEDPRIELIKQNAMCSMSRWDFNRWKDVPNIMTRCPLDTLAYTSVMVKYHDTPEYDYLQMMRYHNEEFKNDPVAREIMKHSLFVYIPIEFAIENDGVRPTDVEYQKQVDQAMRELIYGFGITPIVATGTVEERVKTVLNHLNKIATKELDDAVKKSISSVANELGKAFKY